MCLESVSNFDQLGNSTYRSVEHVPATEDCTARRLRAARVFLNSYPHCYVDQTAIHRKRLGLSTKSYVYAERHSALQF